MLIVASLAVGPAYTASVGATAAPAASSAAEEATTSPLTVAPKIGATGKQTWAFRDAFGREVVLRGFNVAGSAKLPENGFLPFRNQGDAANSAQAMRDQTGANAIRFLLFWEGVQPQPDRIDKNYLDSAAKQIGEFTSRGIYVLVDWHQDLFSAHAFDKDSWFTGSGAPKWVIDGGGYPNENCGPCPLWAQNMMTNDAVRKPAYDFWRNRKITTSAGTVAVQDAYLNQARAAMTHLRTVLPSNSFDKIVGVDPFNEPFDGGLDGAQGAVWEKNFLMPFYQRFRSAMDESGWDRKLAFVEPLVFWNTGFLEQGGLTGVDPLGPRFVFNSHYYDGGRMTTDLTSAGDGEYLEEMNRIRDRADSLSTAPFVSEFGSRMTGWGSERSPWITRAMYQGLDHGVKGSTWWSQAAKGRSALSSTQWHWDLYSGRHKVPMNGNPQKILTKGDAWNDEDFSVVAMDATGSVKPRLDRRVLDRLFPSAVSGDLLAFAYEDMARSGYSGAGEQKAWLEVPSTMPNLAALLKKDPQFGVLVWRGATGPSASSTVLHIPASFNAADMVVVSDVGWRRSVPGTGQISASKESGSNSQRLLIAPTKDSETHVALVVGSGAASATDTRIRAARAELTLWKDTHFTH
ncbi:cellulase family glycosylhydrolase [Streptomyces globisporus]|uniref:cellulase family glycosylhydrolase n=1 Tax=Streptomyces globisporus TaxID=1908 RepID=UPI003821FB69